MSLSRRQLLAAGVLSAIPAHLIDPAHAQSRLSVQDISKALGSAAPTTIYVAREIVTLDPAKPTATAVAVSGDRIVAAGSINDVRAALGSQAM